MTKIPRVLLILALLFPATMSSAQDKYSSFVGQYVAAYQIAQACDGITVYDQQSAGAIAKQSEGLRKHKVLKLLHYGKRDQLIQLSNTALRNRSIDPADTRNLCRFGRSVAGKNDTIGRFLL